MTAAPRIAVMLPCFNEGPAIGAVVRAFKAALPSATVYAYDNASTDDTAQQAAQAGAVVRREPRRGKGYVVQRMFADIEADVYVLADGDGTYDARAVAPMVALLQQERADLVTGVRGASYADSHSRSGHAAGNRLFTESINVLFNGRCTDVLSGYRVMTRRFVKSCPILPRGFEVEVALTIHALEIMCPTLEFETQYAARAEGTTSKLSTFGDGARIALRALVLFKDARPLVFFGGVAVFCGALSLLIGIPVVGEFFSTGLVTRVPSAVLAAALMVVACIALAAGTILNTVSKTKKEAKRLAYLAVKGPTDSTSGAG